MPIHVKLNGIFFMDFLEKDLEQIIYESGRGILSDKGLDVYGKMFRQLNLKQYGIADLITYQKPKYIVSKGNFYRGKITIYELKKDKIGISAFLQALGYAKCILEHLRNKQILHKYQFQIVLIGKTIDLNSNYVFLSDFLAEYLESYLTVSNYTYKFEVDGIKFKRENNYFIK